jgi:hypothetical protein
MTAIKPLRMLCLAAGAAAAMLAAPARADEARPDRLIITYEEPTNPAHRPIYDEMKTRHALEKFRGIFSPFRLPVDLPLTIKGCNGVSNAWYQRPGLTICYEYLDDILKALPTEPTPVVGLTPMDAMLGQVFYVVAHEMGHALFDILDIPLLGRAEDAADQFAAYMMLQLGKDEARRLISGASYSYYNYIRNPKVTVSVTAFADVHGAPAQRFYNMLCIAYGADRETFGDVVTKGFLPEWRAPNCKMEYGEVAFAFKVLFVPHIDQELAKDVMKRMWLPDPSSKPPPPSMNSMQ